MALELSWPLSLDSAGRERTVEQGSLGEVQQGVDLTFTCPEGALLYDPSFGRPEMAFAPDPEDLIHRTIEDQAQRVSQYRVDGDPSAAFLIHVLAVNDYPESA